LAKKIVNQALRKVTIYICIGIYHNLLRRAPCDTVGTVPDTSYQTDSTVVTCAQHQQNLKWKNASCRFDFHCKYLDTLSEAWSEVNWADLMAAQGAFGTETEYRPVIKIGPKGALGSH